MSTTRYRHTTRRRTHRAPHLISAPYRLAFAAFARLMWIAFCAGVLVTLLVINAAQRR